MRYPHLMARVFNTPLAIEDSKFQVILAALAPRLGIEAPTVPASAMAQTEKREIYSVQGGVAVIDVSGTLVNRASGMDAMSGMTSYEELGQELGRALAADDVSGIVLRLNSPGGEVDGLDNFAASVRAATKVKPIWAAVDDYAYSAAYWIASATNRIFITRTGGVGSIGVIAQHLDASEFEKQAGLKYTTVKYGDRKTDFSPHEPLSTEGLVRLQERVDQVGGMFVGVVAKNRQIPKGAVRDTQANTFFGQDAIERGLADEIAGFNQVVSKMLAEVAPETRSLPNVITSRKSRREEIEYRQLAYYGDYQARKQELRMIGGPGEKPLITGHVAVFNEWSLNLGGFIERVMPGAFDKSVREADVHCFLNHDRTIILGRNRSGTLSLKETDSGLHIENDPPDTRTVQDLVIEPMRRGDLDQGSFAFYAVKQEWGVHEDTLARTLYEVALVDVSVVPRGGYPQTDLSLRALTASGRIDHYTLAVIEAKLRHGLALTEQEQKCLSQITETLLKTRELVEPAKSHSAGAAEPSLETLRMRLTLASLAA